ncbi:MAG: TRAP transporter small permease [Kiloniellaceae bacterium]
MSSQQERKLPDLAWPLRLLTAGGLGVIVALTLAQIFFRFVLDRPLIWSEELIKLLLVWVTFVGAAVVSWDARHLNVDVLFSRLPYRLRRAVQFLNAAVAIAFLGFLIEPTLTLVRIENMADMGALGLPSGIVRLPVAVGAGLMILFIVLRLVLRRPRRHGAESGAAEIDPM